MSAERVVIDTNVLVSAALLAKSKPFTVLQHVVETGVLILSNEIFEEVGSRLMRARFDRYLSVPTRQAFLADLAAVAEWTTITGAVHVCRDPDDDKVLETAAAGRANWLVTGDRDLLELHPFGEVAIVTPQSFLERVT